MATTTSLYQHRPDRLWAATHVRKAGSDFAASLEVSVETVLPNGITFEGGEVRLVIQESGIAILRQALESIELELAVRRGAVEDQVEAAK